MNVVVWTPSEPFAEETKVPGDSKGSFGEVLRNPIGFGLD
jgi:hypothetical protein